MHHVCSQLPIVKVSSVCPGLQLKMKPVELQESRSFCVGMWEQTTYFQHSCPWGKTTFCYITKGEPIHWCLLCNLEALSCLSEIGVWLQTSSANSGKFSSVMPLSGQFPPDRQGPPRSCAALATRALSTPSNGPGMISAEHCSVIWAQHPLNRFSMVYNLCCKQPALQLRKQKGF